MIIPTRIFTNFLLLQVDHRKMEDILERSLEKFWIKIRFVSFSNFTRIKHHLKNRTGRNLNSPSQFQDTSNDVSKSKIIARQFRDHYRGRATSPLRAEASDKRVALLYYKRVSRGCIYATCTGIESKLFITSSPARHFITPFNSCIVQMRNKNNERATRTAILSAPSRKRDG